MDDDGPRAGQGGQMAQNSEKFERRVLRPGEGFGNYRVVDCLCAGLIANYYHMQHIRDLRDVTVGVFHHRTAKDLKFTKRLRSLQKTLKDVDHEGVPKILDCTTISEHICLFLEPVKGQTLSHYFDAHATPGREGLSPESTTRILAQVLGLLGYAHTKGVDHRDLDSDMIFIQEDGSIRLLGLGVKAALGTELFESIVSASVSPLAPNSTGGRLNSFDVMSPEYKAGKPEDARVDLYGTGAIGYWLLTARKPGQANRESPTALVEDLPPGWDEYLNRLLERNRDERFQSCRMALLALKDINEAPEPESGGFIQRQIDRIPVLKSIRARGELATRIYRLSLIGLVGVVLTGLAAYSLHVLFTEERNYRKEVVRVAAGGQSLDLVVEVRPTAAKIDFSGFDQSFITNKGRLELLVRPGEYKLRAAAPHHLEKSERVTIEAEAEGPPQRVRFDLEPEKSDVRIQSEPGATVSVIDADGVETELGSTDEEGRLSLQKALSVGSYQVLFEKEGYAREVLKDQKVDHGEVFTIEAPLAALPASLSVKTSPPGARIKIDDADAGLSPLLVDEIAPDDQYRIVAQLENYRTVKRRVEVDPGQEIVVDFGELIPRSAELHIEANFEGLGEEASAPLLEETFVVLGERRYPFGSPELKSVPEGAYTLRLEHPLYTSAPGELTLADRDVKQIDVTLTPRPAQVQLILPGNLEVSARLGKKVFKLDGDTISIPADKAVELELRIKNHLNMTKKFELKPREKAVWKVEPVPIPGPAKGRDWTMPYLGIKLAWIPPGQLLMGSPMREQGRLPNEGERTEVTFTQGFWAAVHEVTQPEFREIMDQMPAAFFGARHPVDSVTWEEANAFCRALTTRERAAGRLPEGYVYRLPTEAEWEYAARAGSKTPFHFGEQADTTYGNFRGIYPRESAQDRPSTETYGTEPVGSYTPNAYGLYDIHGNVSEWTAEAYSGRLPGGRVTDPAPRTGGARYTLRGGSWEESAVRVRSAARAEARQDTESNAIGFRVFLAPER